MAGWRISNNKYISNIDEIECIYFSNRKHNICESFNVKFDGGSESTFNCGPDMFFVGFEYDGAGMDGDTNIGGLCDIKKIRCCSMIETENDLLNG